jgi:hypothetical protein
MAKDTNNIVPKHRVILQGVREGKTIPEAMVAAGYAPNVESINPSGITAMKKSRSWKAMMQEYLPEQNLLNVHRELLNKHDIEYMWEDERIMDGDRYRIVRKLIKLDKGIDVQAASKALEMGYKLHGRFTPDNIPAPAPAIYNLFYKPEIQSSLRSFENTLKAQIISDSTGQDVHTIEAEVIESDSTKAEKPVDQAPKRGRGRPRRVLPGTNPGR